MIDRLGLTPAIHAQLIGHAGELFPMLAEIDAALSRLAKLERALHVIPFARAHGREELARALEFLQMHLAQLGLGVEGIDMARPASHIEKNAPLRLGLRKMPLLRRQRPLCLLRPQHRMKRQGPQATVDSVDKFASIHWLNPKYEMLNPKQYRKSKF